MSKNKKYYNLDISDIPLIDYTNIFVGNLAWINRGVHDSIATFDLVVRDMPENWGFYIMDGVERFVDFLLQFKFNKNSLEILNKMGLTNSPETKKFYKNFKFSGEVLAIPDGTIFFPGEPIVRITAPLSEANMLTGFCLNSFCYPVRILTKTIRVKIAAKDKQVTSWAAARIPGFEQQVWTMRANLLAGNKGAVGHSPQFYVKFPELKPTGKFSANINHAFIKSFPSENAALKYVFEVLQPNTDNFLVMIDTYGLRNGIEIFINEAKKAKVFDTKKFTITIDSGDLLEQSIHVRKRLDAEGFKDIKIQVFSNLEEYKINDLIEAGAPIDYYIAGTEVVNITDNLSFEAVYKMAELRHKDGRIEYKAKLATGKNSLPARKQVFRVFDPKGNMKEDIIGLENEKLGKPLLKLFIKNGKQVRKIPNMTKVGKDMLSQLEKLPEAHKKTRNPAKYPVSVSEKLQKLFNEVKAKHG